jgi:hypothetical protein
MKYSKPQPFKEALSASQVKTLLPTGLSSAELEQFPADVLERGRFSARVRSATHLDVLDQGVNALLEGKTDLATARLNLKQFLQDTGYLAPEEDRGTLTDFASDERTNLQLRTNVQMAQGYGYWKQGQDTDLLDAFPASELIRVEDRAVPRGEKRGPHGALVPDPENSWPARWNRARAATTADGATDSSSGRMVALKGHPIWVKLSRFGQPYEPFDYNSGMGLRDVPRRDAMKLGIIGRNTIVPPQDRPFNADLQASPEIRSDTLRSLLEQTGVGQFDSDGVFVATGGDS